MDSPWPLYPRGSRAWIWQRIGAGLGIVAVLGTVAAVVEATHRGRPDWVFVLAAVWGIAPPLWWWIEFFFVYPPHHTEKKFELIKYGAQISLAIWAPIAVALAAYGASDRFKTSGEPTARIEARR